MSATLKDLAKETGLSIATISKYINGIHVKEENQEVIQQAIDKLNYTVNEYARYLKVNKSRTVGILIPELTNTFSTQIITKIEEVLRPEGYSILICDCHDKSELEFDAVNFLLSKKVDGIINVPQSSNSTNLLPAIEKNIPVITIDKPINPYLDKIDRVLTNNYSISIQAIQHLIENNHQEIGIIIGPKDVFTSQWRLKGYISALEKNNIPFKQSLVQHCDYTIQGGYEALKKLIKNNPSMTAVYVTNYESTLGAIIYANESHLKIPEELSFVGFDNLELSKVIHPKLTMVCQPIEEIGKTVADLILFKMTSEKPTEVVERILPSSLVYGDSVAKI